jgi:predicted MFS family arabinose efflux permease
MLFGLSKTFVTLLISRALSGALNGNIGVMRSMMAELTDETNQAQAFSFMQLVCSGELGVL